MTSMTPEPAPGAAQPTEQSVPNSRVRSDRPGAPAPAAPPRRGTIAWALGFLACLPLPVVGLVVAGVTQLIVGLSQRKHGGLAATNGVRAANWGLTQLCWPALMLVIAIIGIATGEPGSEGGVHLTPVMEAVTMAMLVLFIVVGLLQLIYAVIGTILATRGAEVRLPVIPFLRVPRG